MVIERWNPWADLRRFDDMFNRLWRSSLAGTEAGEAWGIPVDVYQEGENVVVQASLPGVDPEKIDVTVEDGVLTIKAESTEEKEERGDSFLLRERRTGSFYRALRLPETVDEGKAKSEYKNGVLKVKFPKHESKKARRLEVVAD
jgi:HSP20 family protein